jgi:hypothetical protein
LAEAFGTGLAAGWACAAAPEGTAVADKPAAISKVRMAVSNLSLPDEMIDFGGIADGFFGVDGLIDHPADNANAFGGPATLALRPQR